MHKLSLIYFSTLPKVSLVLIILMPEVTKKISFLMSCLWEKSGKYHLCFYHRVLIWIIASLSHG